MSSVIKATATNEFMCVPFACSLRFGNGEKLVLIDMKMSENDLVCVDKIKMKSLYVLIRSK